MEAGKSVFSRCRLAEKSDTSDQREREITNEDFGRATGLRTKINYCVGNKQRNERHREFVFLWKYAALQSANSASARSWKASCARNNQSPSDAVCDGRKNEKKSGNHSEESIRPVRYAKGITVARLCETPARALQTSAARFPKGSRYSGFIGTLERFVKPRLATLRGVSMNDPAFGGFVRLLRSRADLIELGGPEERNLLLDAAQTCHHAADYEAIASLSGGCAWAADSCLHYLVEKFVNVDRRGRIRLSKSHSHGRQLRRPITLKCADCFGRLRVLVQHRRRFASLAFFRSAASAPAIRICSSSVNLKPMWEQVAAPPLLFRLVPVRRITRLYRGAFGALATVAK